MGLKKVSSSLKSLTGYPIMSVSRTEFRNFSSRSQSQDGTELHLWLDSFSEIFRDEEFYNVECNLRQSCVHLTSLEPQQVYLGCDGIPKLRSDPLVLCTSQGKECPDLAAARTKLGKFSSCDEAEGFVGSKNKTFWPQPTCSDWTGLDLALENWKACSPAEDKFWAAAFQRRSTSQTHTCVMRSGQGKNSTLIIPRTRPGGRARLCGQERPVCRRWGPWLSSPCRANKQTRHRFCKIRFSQRLEIYSIF